MKTETTNEKINVKMMAFDLDDTLLNRDLKITPRTITVLRKAAKAGIYIVLCSGRTENAILPHIRALEIAGLETGRYLIAMNGASIFDMHKRLQIYRRFVEGDLLQEIFTECEKNNLPAQVYNPDTIFASVDNKWTRVDANLCSLRLEIVPKFKEFLSIGHSKMVIPGEPEILAEFEKSLKSKYGESAVIFTSKPYFLEIMPKATGKGEAIEFLANELKIPMKNVMAFGDSYNDETMIRKAGYGVCMVNGNDDIKAVADFVTRKDNNNDGIADFLEEFVDIPD